MHQSIFRAIVVALVDASTLRARRLRLRRRFKRLIHDARARHVRDAHRARLAAGLAAVRDFMESHREHFEWPEPAGGTFGFARLRAPGVSAEAYAEVLRKRAGLMLMPSSHFHFGDERLRVCFGRDAEITAERLARWDDDVRCHGIS